MPGDLHTHTNFSDGSSDIETLPFLARRAGMTFLAVSDHDTILSAQYALDHPCAEGVQLIPAAELTAFDAKRARRVHLLCYYPQLVPALRAHCETMAQRRNFVTDQSIADLEKLYPQFTRAAAKAYSARSGVTYKTHLIRLLFELGYTDGIYKDLYRELFGAPNGKVLHDPVYEPLDTVLETIRQSRGVCVLAHPSVYRSMELAQELAAAGKIDGVEIDHPRNRPEDRETLRRLARRYDLIVTGGTDFHGMHMSRPVPLGAMATTDDNIRRLEALAKERQHSAQD